MQQKEITELVNYKEQTLTLLREFLEPVASKANKNEKNHKKRAQIVNAQVEAKVNSLRDEIMSISEKKTKQHKLLVLEYCSSIVSLQYRHQVWPYEYMAFSRRIGELWERFCKACWESPSADGVSRVQAPKFSKIVSKIQENISSAIDSLQTEKKNVVLQNVKTLLTLVGDINMNEDEVFAVNGQLHVVDFKSGFGSNEKGNTLRLLAVGRAYKQHDQNTRLMLMVRQAENNNYLEILRSSGVWEVFCADRTYELIEQLTGAEISKIRAEIINFNNDLSETFINDLTKQLSDLTEYLKW